MTPSNLAKSPAFAASIKEHNRFDPIQPIGFCIYCGQNDASLLTDEHIAPEGLLGTMELKKASCEQCAGKTGTLRVRFLKDHSRRFASASDCTAGVEERNGQTH